METTTLIPPTANSATPAPSAPAMAAARYLNERTDRILKHMGIATGELTEASHAVTARMIDEQTKLPEIIAALREIVAAEWESAQAFGTPQIIRLEAALKKAEAVLAEIPTT